MQIWAIARVRNEADIVDSTIRNLLEQGVDRVLVLDHMSDDGTRAMLEELAVSSPVEIVTRTDPAYPRAEAMNYLARRAAEAGADWIVPFDADEIWRAYHGTLRGAFARAKSPILVGQMFDHFPRPTFRTGDVVRRLPWNRTSMWAKVAFRWEEGAELIGGNHNVNGIDAEPVWGEIFIDHYPWRSWAQYRRKMRDGAAALRLANAEPWQGKYTQHVGSLPDWQIRLNWWRLRLNPKLRRRDRGTVKS